MNGMLMADTPPDYTTMSGAEFQRAVGVDPEKWAVAMLQAMYLPPERTTNKEQIAFLAKWLADAMDAAVKAHDRHIPII
jgi:hypothetical protein